MGEEPGVGIVESFIELAAYIVNIGGSLIMLVGFVTAFVTFTMMYLRRSGSYAKMQDIRCKLGNHLALGLELMIIADVLETLVTQSMQDLAYLGGLVAIRTVLAFFLGREIAEFRQGTVTWQQEGDVHDSQ